MLGCAKIWSYVKFLAKNGVVPSFCQKYGNMLNFAKNMELCQVLLKIWSYVRLCQKYGVMLRCAKNMELYQVFAISMEIC
jgi:hypothetical protein